MIAHLDLFVAMVFGAFIGIWAGRLWGQDKMQYRITPTTNTPTHYLIKRRYGFDGSWMYLAENDRWFTNDSARDLSKFESRETAQKFLDDYLTSK